MLFYSLLYNSNKYKEKELCFNMRLKLGAIGLKLRDKLENILNIYLLKKKTLASFTFIYNARQFALNNLLD